MKIKVNNKIHDISIQSYNQTQGLFKKLHENDILRTNVECLCNENRIPHPVMSVKKYEKKYVLVNKPSSHGEHETACFYNKKYREGARKKGITIKDDGTIEVKKLDTSKRHASSSDGERIPNSRNNNYYYYENDPLCTCRVSSLFLTMLQKYNWHEYKPNGQRNLSGRLYTTGLETVVEGVTLNLNNLFVAKSEKQFVSSQRLVIGWGNINNDALPGNIDFKVKIPLYSVNDSSKLVTHIEVEETVYKEAKIVADKIRNNVEQGFWVIWREPHVTKKGKQVVVAKYISFIPAEQTTKIPVESSYEETMVKYLVEEERHFKKPLIGDINDEHGIKLRPDMILYDTPKATMIEVAGDNSEKYLNRLEKKKEIYLRENYSYLEWLAMNGDPLPILTFKK
jgi:hypothetical protein